jgi:hypothetical protein
MVSRSKDTDHHQRTAPTWLQNKKHEAQHIMFCGMTRAFDKYSRRYATRIRAAVMQQVSESEQHVPGSVIRQRPLSATLFPELFLRILPSGICIPTHPLFSVVP